MNYELDKILKAFKKIIQSFWLVALAGVLAFCGTAVLTYGETKDTYQASVCIYSSGDYLTAQMDIAALYSYSFLLSSEELLDNVYEALDGEVALDKITSMISVTTDGSTITLTAKAEDPEQCVKLANAAAEEYKLGFSMVTGVESVKIMDQLISPSVLINGNAQRRKTRLLLSLAVALGVAVIIGIRDLISNKIEAPWMATGDGEITLLGVIPEVEM